MKLIPWLTVQTSPWAWPCCSSKHTTTIVTQTTISLMSAILLQKLQCHCIYVCTNHSFDRNIEYNYHMHPTYIPCCTKAVYSKYIAVGNRMIFITSVDARHWRRKRGGAGGYIPPERWTQGAAPPYKLVSMGLGNMVRNKTASDYPQWYGTEAHRVFLRPGSAANSNCSTR